MVGSLRYEYRERLTLTWQFKSVFGCARRLRFRTPGEAELQVVFDKAEVFHGSDFDPFVLPELKEDGEESDQGPEEFAGEFDTRVIG